MGGTYPPISCSAAAALAHLFTQLWSVWTTCLEDTVGDLVDEEIVSAMASRTSSNSVSGEAKDGTGKIYLNPAVCALLCIWSVHNVRD